MSAYAVESFVSSSVRKKPGSTIVVWMPNGSISNRNDSISPPHRTSRLRTPNKLLTDDPGRVSCGVAASRCRPRRDGVPLGRARTAARGANRRIGLDEGFLSGRPTHEAVRELLHDHRPAAA